MRAESVRANGELGPDKRVTHLLDSAEQLSWDEVIVITAGCGFPGLS